ncbi:MAG: helix-turn-helix transcriptional regulator [Firmicutes bacterium]|nr:helix-turn-helix transcriptional regulator [Bacillota bacterium]
MLKSNLRYLMADRKIDTISDLMEKSGLSRNAINSIYKEKNMETTKLNTLIKLCDALRCTLSELIEYNPE